MLVKDTPSSRFLPRMTRIAGFDISDPVVALAAGYTFWLALTASGRVFACDTAFDGYAGLLPGTLHHGGWHVVNEVCTQCSQAYGTHARATDLFQRYLW